MSHRPFVSGLDLSRALYEESVAPVLSVCHPDLRYGAALIGPGSEVLGFDTEQSTDHDWGPRLLLFLSAREYATRGAEIAAAVVAALPDEVCGYPTRMATDNASEERDYHPVSVHTAGGYFESILGVDPGGELRPAHWLTFTEQRLRSLTAGGVFRDDDDELAKRRAKLLYFPHDLWLYMLAAQWRRVAQEEAFMGRCAQVGDELGSRLVAGRLVRDIMRLCFLMERTYAPYIKWLGTAFRALDCAAALEPVLLRVVGADNFHDRERELSAAYEMVATMHNGLGLTDPLAAAVRRFYDRPFLVISADRIADAIRERIVDSDVLALPEHLGSVDQFTDSTDAAGLADRFHPLYENPNR